MIKDEISPNYTLELICAAIAKTRKIQLLSREIQNKLAPLPFMEEGWACLVNYSHLEGIDWGSE